MAGNNRYLRGKMGTVLAPVHASTVINAGDFIFINNAAGILGAGVAADSYIYPFDRALNAASPGTGVINGIYTQFMGIAMESSPSGVTENITVATEGVFRYPISKLTAVTVGYQVSAVSYATSGIGVSPQYVAIVGAGEATTAYLGHIVKTESATSYVDFELGTIYNKLVT